MGRRCWQLCKIHNGLPSDAACGYRWQPCTSFRRWYLCPKIGCREAIWLTRWKTFYHHWNSSLCFFGWISMTRAMTMHTIKTKYWWLYAMTQIVVHRHILVVVDDDDNGDKWRGGGGRRMTMKATTNDDDDDDEWWWRRRRWMKQIEDNTKRNETVDSIITIVSEL